MEKNIIWLASYPKSGNTWMRVFLSALMREADVDLRNLAVNKVYQDRSVLTRHLELDCSLLTANEIAYYQPLAWQHEAAETPWPLLIKTHETYRRNNAGNLIHLPAFTDRAVYIVRNPLDVCISLKYFINVSIDDAISLINDSNGSSEQLFHINTNKQLPGFFGCWSTNVSGWINQTDFPVLVVRYEDLLDRPLDEFTRVVQFLKLQYNSAQIAGAVAAAEFGNLAKKEKVAGFDRPPTTNAFFREGTKNQWKTALTTAQVERVVNPNYEVMKKLNYI